MITMLFFFVHSLVSNKTILKIYSIALLTTGMMLWIFMYLNQSFDGRFWPNHFLDVHRVKGRAFLIYWSWANWHRMFDVIR